MTVNEDWFDGGFVTYKNPIPIKYEVASGPGTVNTLEGPVRYDTGHIIITGPKSEQYPVSPEKFSSLYDVNGDGTATPKKLFKVAKIADHDGLLHTSWGDLHYTSGNDYIVRHGLNDYGAVKKDIFQKTYKKETRMSEWKAFPMDQPWPKERELVLVTNMPGDDEGTLCYFSEEGYQQRHFMEKETGMPFGLMVCFWKPIPTTKKLQYTVVDNLSSLLTVLQAFFKRK